MTLTADLKARIVLQTDSRFGRALPHMLRSAGLAMGLSLLFPAVGWAQQVSVPALDHPVVLELFTAQGCASCPPADDMMLDLAQREDVIALALHVDYWDYIGWVDSFADPENGQRQQRYARRHGQSTIYTPQVIINGIDVVEGFRVMQVMDTIAAHRAQASETHLTLTRGEGGGLEIRAERTAEIAPVIAMASRRSAMPNAVVGTLSMGDMSAEAATVPSVQAEMAGPGSFAIELVRYRPTDEVSIDGGENSGRTAQFANIVTSWETVGTWDMTSTLEMTVPIEGTDPVVVIVQEVGQGEIVAAARLR